MAEGPLKERGGAVCTGGCIALKMALLIEIMVTIGWLADRSTRLQAWICLAAWQEAAWRAFHCWMRVMGVMTRTLEGSGVMTARVRHCMHCIAGHRPMAPPVASTARPSRWVHMGLVVTVALEHRS